MKDILEHLAKGKIFTKLYLREAWYRVRIKESDEWKTSSNFPLSVQNNAFWTVAGACCIYAAPKQAAE